MSVHCHLPVPSRDTSGSLPPIDAYISSSGSLFWTCFCRLISSYKAALFKAAFRITFRRRYTSKRGFRLRWRAEQTSREGLRVGIRFVWDKVVPKPFQMHPAKPCTLHVLPICSPAPRSPPSYFLLSFFLSLVFLAFHSFFATRRHATTTPL